MRPTSVLLHVAARPLRVAILIASVWILFRGHNAPGGGFIGGLVAVSATILQCLVRPPQLTEGDDVVGTHVRLATSGVLLAAATGLPALLVGGAFLTHEWTTLSFGSAEFPLSAVLLFDLGVYLCVWGGLGGYVRALLAVEPDEADEVAAP